MKPKIGFAPRLKPMSKLKEVKEILIVSLSNIGDVVLTTPVITALRGYFPEAKITVVVGERAVSLLEGSRLIDRLVIYRKKSSLFSKLGFLAELLKRRYDLVVDLRHTLIPFLVSARRRSPVLRRSRALSMREKHLEVLKKMGFEIPDLPCFDFFSAAEKKSFLADLKAKGIAAAQDWILMAPAAASQLKSWRLEGFGEVLAEIVRERSEPVFLVGHERERSLLEKLASRYPGKVFNLAGETTLRELAFAVSACSLLITNDSAVMHLGFEMNRRVVALFGPTSSLRYGRTGPRFRMVTAGSDCSPCEQPVCRFQRQHCFEDLNSTKVLAACWELLGESNPSVRSPR